MNAPPPDGPSHVAPPVADPLDRSRFPVDEWRLVETRFDASDLGTTESLFSVGNGYLGLRGNYSESRDAHVDGTYINGFHETWPILHAEEAYGFARVGQTIVNAPDAKVIRLYVDDEPFQMSLADLLEYERALDFRSGMLSRDLVWRTPGGKEVRVKSTRMVPLAQRHLAIITFEVTLLDQKASVAISSQLLNRQDAAVELIMSEPGATDPRKAERFNRRVLEPDLHSAEGTGSGGRPGRIALGYRTAESGMTIGVVADHDLQTASPYSLQVHSEDDMAKVIYRVSAEPGVPIRLTKLVSYHTAVSVPPRELIDRCERTLDRTHEQGVEHQRTEQRQWLADFWSRCDVEIPGHPDLQQAVRWNLFSICQAASRAEGQGIAAKGVTGSGYGGHYFWDTEIYVMPFLTYTMPWAARNALRFRYSLLDSGRSRARELSQRGALFPWRTINGHEASAYYAAGTAQYHIDADIAYALAQYVGATGDDDFLTREAIDILVETARLWADLGFWRDDGAGPGGSRTFHIHGVTGPDEYTTVVNDNLYTNVLARANLRIAAHEVWQIQRDDPAAYVEMVRRTGLEPDEPDEWAECAQSMFIPYDDFLGIHPQDAHFLEREMWDLENTPLEKRPLLLNYHPLVIYRFQVLKQADVVLALFLQGDDFTAEEKRANFDYYDPITTGDSTLSAVVQSIIASEVGYADLALRYFHAALFVDLDDRHNNTADGVHVASTGGVWSALVCGFGGFRDHGPDQGEDQWQIDPRLPASWPSLVYRITLHGTRVRVTVRSDELELFVEDGPGPLCFNVRGEQVKVQPGPPVVVPLEHQGPRLEGGPPNPAGIQRADGTVISAIVPSGDGG
ncbi:glycoside hydrolase family 65 protein [Nocardioides immobilis]|uniref:Glycoside hydrolase family 65 protein n=1 Tax=Nocardioides immobilis TaxID=2049295 RepID=A0A417Y1E7_9ACTN|nr:glycosyl hydrolase family 65 protein [Nocardioides immobilis]RHW26488.1 glycoside hydrolase family 65 protein [Nocardioides immobilis]